MTGPEVEDATGRRRRSHTVVLLGSAGFFAVAVSLTSVAYPLIAVRSGYSASAVGALTAVSAITQILSRSSLTSQRIWRSRRLAITVATATMILSPIVLVASRGPGVFVASEILQGVARGLFWSSLQVEATRGRRFGLDGLARLNLVSGVGRLIGPLLAGMLLTTALANVLAVSGATGLLAASVVPLAQQRSRSRAAGRAKSMGSPVRLGQVRGGMVVSTLAGAWSGVLTSYVPVVLAASGQPANTIGVLVAVANAGALVGSMLLLRGSEQVRRLWPVIACAIPAGVALIGWVSVSKVLGGAVLLLAGVVAGILQPLGPAVGGRNLSGTDRQKAVATVGASRAVSMFCIPGGIALLLLAVPLDPALTIAGVALAGPLVLARRYASTE